MKEILTKKYISINQEIKKFEVVNTFKINVTRKVHLIKKFVPGYI